MTDQELAMQALRNRENEIEANQSPEPETSLGRVQSNKPVPSEEDSAIHKIVTGQHIIPMEDLSYKGAFYKKGWTIKYKSASGQDIRHFSMVDDENPLAVDDAIKQMLASCVSVYNERGDKVSYNKLTSLDRLIILLKIREVTYPNPESTLSYDTQCTCGKEFKIELGSDTIEFSKFNEDQAKNYNEDERCFVIPTRNSGDIKVYPLTIEREALYREYLINQTKAKQKVDTLFAELVWIFLTPHNMHGKNPVENAVNEYLSRSPKQLAMYIAINERYKLQPVTQVVSACPNPACGKEVHNDITFPNRLKYLFIDTASGAEELL